MCTPRAGSSNRARPLAFLLSVLCATGCATWQPASEGPRQLIERGVHPRVRVVRSDAAPVVVRNPRIVNDSIATVSGPCRRLPGLEPRYSCPTEGVVALSDVTGIEVVRPSKGRMALLALPVVLFFAFRDAEYCIFRPC